jgi:NADH-quinone oxidoreductase subunit J
MSASVIIFYCIAAFILITGFLAVTGRKIFRSAIALLFSLTGIAGLYFWMDVNFIAAVQIIVYVGGIVILIIFSIFLTHHSGEELPKTIVKRTIFSLLAVLAGLGLTCNLIYQYGFSAATDQPTTFKADVADIGTQMLSTTDYGYVLPFELVSILLLAALIGCIVIAMKVKQEEK